jgi:phosphatidylglycerophosphate synthase
MSRERGEEGVYDRSFERGARFLLARGVHPNHFTFLQLPVFALEVVAAIQGWSLAFALSTLLVIVLDGGDGILARVGRLQTRSGAVLDSVFDIMGITIILWGAAQFHPDYYPWLVGLFFGNAVLFVQNALLETKYIAYLRGPVVIGVVWPEVLFVALLVPSLVIAVLLLLRLRPTAKALAARVPL